MRMVVEVEAELTGRTLAEFESELMGGSIQPLATDLSSVVASTPVRLGKRSLEALRAA